VGGKKYSTVSLIFVAAIQSNAGNGTEVFWQNAPHATLPARRRNVALLMAIVATICAVMVAAVFVLAWRDKDVLLIVVLGVVLFSLLVLAMLAVRVSL
jgi:hypothetical protein